MSAESGSAPGIESAGAAASAVAPETAGFSIGDPAQNVGISPEFSSINATYSGISAPEFSQFSPIVTEISRPETLSDVDFLPSAEEVKTEIESILQEPSVLIEPEINTSDTQIDPAVNIAPKTETRQPETEPEIISDDKIQILEPKPATSMPFVLSEETLAPKSPKPKTQAESSVTTIAAQVVTLGATQPQVEIEFEQIDEAEVAADKKLAQAAIAYIRTLDLPQQEVQTWTEKFQHVQTKAELETQVETATHTQTQVETQTEQLETQMQAEIEIADDEPPIITVKTGQKRPSGSSGAPDEEKPWILYDIASQQQEAQDIKVRRNQIKTEIVNAVLENPDKAKDTAWKKAYLLDETTIAEKEKIKNEKLTVPGIKDSIQTSLSRTEEDEAQRVVQIIQDAVNSNLAQEKIDAVDSQRSVRVSQLPKEAQVLVSLGFQRLIRSKKEGWKPVPTLPYENPQESQKAA